MIRSPFPPIRRTSRRPHEYVRFVVTDHNHVVDAGIIVVLYVVDDDEADDVLVDGTVSRLDIARSRANERQRLSRVSRGKTEIWREQPMQICRRVFGRGNCVYSANNKQLNVYYEDRSLCCSSMTAASVERSMKRTPIM